MANLGLQVKLPQDHPVVTVITKKGRRSIENAAQIADRLRDRFPEAEIALVDGNSLNAVPLKTRVSLRQSMYTMPMTHAALSACPRQDHWLSCISLLLRSALHGHAMIQQVR